MIQIKFENLGNLLNDAYEKFIEEKNKPNATFVTLPGEGYYYGLQHFIRQEFSNQEIWVSGFDWDKYKDDKSSSYYWRYNRPTEKIIDGVAHVDLREMLDSCEILNNYFDIAKESDVNVVMTSSSKGRNRDFLLSMPILIDFTERNIETLGAAFLHSVVNLANANGFSNFRLNDRRGNPFDLPPLPTLNSPIRDEILASALLRSVADKPMVFARFFNEERAKRGIVGHLKQKEVQVLLEKFLES